MDATIVTRILDAGATILGKAVVSISACPAAATPPTRAGPQPAQARLFGRRFVLRQRALVAPARSNGDRRRPGRVDPHARILLRHLRHEADPGLVPYTGVMPIETTIDHTGPMTATVADNALLLEVLAGPDGLDPRQYSPQVAPYTKRSAAAQGDEDRHREGRLRPPRSRRRWTTSGAGGRRALPGWAPRSRRSRSREHLHRRDLDPIALEGATAQMMLGNGMGFNWKGLYVRPAGCPCRVAGRADDLSETLKISMLVGSTGDQYRGRYYAKAQNLVRRMKAAYDAALAHYDLLLMPTLPWRNQAAGPAGPPSEIVIAPSRWSPTPPVRRHRPPRHVHPLRPGQRAAGRADADRQGL